MRTLSDRQQRILSFIHDFLEEKGYPPTIRDILKACQISSTSVVDYNLDVLEREGHIRRDAEVSRGIELQDRRRRRERLVPVPVIGRIAAGEPIPVPAPDNWNILAAAEVVELSQELTRGQEKVYALRVKGTSLVDALIDDGDIVLMQYVTAAENGDLVAVWLKAEGEVTLKRFYREPGRIRLQPANSQMQPIYAEPANVEVQGKVIAVVRQLE